MFIPLLLVVLGVGGLLAYKHAMQNAGGQIALPGASCTSAEIQLVNSTLQQLAATGSAPKEQIVKAYEIAARCLPETAGQLKGALERLATAKLTAAPPSANNAKALALLNAPDLAANPIPNAKVTLPYGQTANRPLWSITGIADKRVAVPGNPEILASFQNLQRLVGVKPDGKIGVNTLHAFVKLAEDRGFAKHPKSVDELAANAAKWGVILNSRTRVD